MYFCNPRDDMRKAMVCSMQAAATEYASQKSDWKSRAPSRWPKRKSQIGSDVACKWCHTSQGCPRKSGVEDVIGRMQELRWGVPENAVTCIRHV